MQLIWSLIKDSQSKSNNQCERGACDKKQSIINRHISLPKPTRKIPNESYSAFFTPLSNFQKNKRNFFFIRPTKLLAQTRNMTLEKAVTVFPLSLPISLHRDFWAEVGRLLFLFQFFSLFYSSVPPPE